jgi:hypothetical protein
VQAFGHTPYSYPQPHSTQLPTVTLHTVTHSHTTYSYPQPHSTPLPTVTLHTVTHSHTPHSYPQPHSIVTHSHTPYSYPQPHSIQLPTVTPHTVTHSHTPYSYPQSHSIQLPTATPHTVTHSHTPYSYRKHIPQLELSCLLRSLAMRSTQEWLNDRGTSTCVRSTSQKMYETTNTKIQQVTCCVRRYTLNQIRMNICFLNVLYCL